MPLSRASRGVEKRTGVPSTRKSPSVCWCSPETILMRVDLPAPLSPRTQVTRLGWTFRSTPCRARMLPYDLPARRSSTIVPSSGGTVSWRMAPCVPVPLSVIGSPPGRRALDPQIDQDGAEEHHAEEGLEPVGVPAGVDDALVHHAEHEGTEDRADRGAVAAGEQTAADDGRGDVDQLLADALAGLHGVEGEQLVHAEEPGTETHGHEQRDLGELHGDTDGPRGLLAAADREDPVAVLGAQQHPGGDGREDQPPHHGDLHLHPADVEGRGEDLLRLA